MRIISRLFFSLLLISCKTNGSSKVAADEINKENLPTWCADIPADKVGDIEACQVEDQEWEQVAKEDPAPEWCEKIPQNEREEIDSCKKPKNSLPEWCSQIPEAERAEVEQCRVNTPKDDNQVNDATQPDSEKKKVPATEVPKTATPAPSPAPAKDTSAEESAIPEWCYDIDEEFRSDNPECTGWEQVGSNDETSEQEPGVTTPDGSSTPAVRDNTNQANGEFCSEIPDAYKELVEECS